MRKISKNASTTVPPESVCAHNRQRWLSEGLSVPSSKSRWQNRKNILSVVPGLDNIYGIKTILLTTCFSVPAPNVYSLPAAIGFAGHTPNKRRMPAATFGRACACDPVRGHGHLYDLRDQTRFGKIHRPKYHIDAVWKPGTAGNGGTRGPVSTP